MFFAIYRSVEPEKGRIVNHGGCGIDSLSAQMQIYEDGQHAMVAQFVRNATEQYVNEWGVQERPVMAAVSSGTKLRADGEDKITISGLPTPSIVSINGVEKDCDVSEITLRTTRPGTFDILVRAWPMQDWSSTVEAF